MFRLALSTLLTLLMVSCAEKEKTSTSVKMKITGMYCAACVVNVGKALNHVPGVTGVRMNAARAEAFIKIDRSLLDTQSLTEAVNKCGFTAALIDLPQQTQQ
jgi:copper chaperone CopZ